MKTGLRLFVHSVLVPPLLIFAGCGPGDGGDSGLTASDSGSTEDTAASDSDESESGGDETGDPECEAPEDPGGEPMLVCHELPGGCGDCIWEKCCELADLCTVNADCACMTMCISTQSVGGVSGCLESCGLTGSPPGFTDLLGCAASACSNAGGVGGECSVPAGFEFPPEAEPPPPWADTGIGSGTLEDCGFGPPDPSGSVLQLENEEGSICVRIERRDDGNGNLANTKWTLLSMHVGPLGEVALIEEPNSMCWYSSHHNFNDWAHAWSGGRYYEVKASYAGHNTPQTYTLHVSQQPPMDPGSCAPNSDGVCSIATMELFAVD